MSHAIGQALKNFAVAEVTIVKNPVRYSYITVKAIHGLLLKKEKLNAMPPETLTPV